MSANLAALLYLVAGVLFILALRGLSSPDTSRGGNRLGMIGMTIAVLTTLAAHPPSGIGAWVLVLAGIGLGGAIGAVIARKVPMTSMPELVAAFHSLVGMGENILILAFVVIVIGGIGSIRGALVGAILVGAIDTLGRTLLQHVLREFLPPQWASAAGPAIASIAVYVFMAIVLAIKPQGLFPART